MGAIILGDGNFCFRTVGENVQWKDGTIRKGRIEIRSSHVSLQGIRTEYSWMHSFHISGGKSNRSADIHKTYKDIKVEGCISYRSRRHGFAMHRGAYAFSASDSADLGNFENIQFINCQAIEPGYSETGTIFSPYDYGFGIENVLSASNITFMHCYAYRAPGCGWHVESRVNTKAISLIDCIAEKNGVAPNGYPYGFMFKGGYSFNNCWAISNYKGGFVSIAPYTGGDFELKNSGEKGCLPLNYKSSEDDDQFILNLAAGGIPACSTIYLGGNNTIPMRCIPADIFTIRKSEEPIEDMKGKVSAQWRDCIINEKSIFDEENRPTSIATQPVRVDQQKLYKISVAMRELSGEKGSPWIYVQEFDKNFKLITHLFRRFSLKTRITNLSSDRMRFVKIYFGKTSDGPNHGVTQSSFPFDQETRWVRVTLVLTEQREDNKHYSVSEFSVTKMLQDPFAQKQKL